MLVHLVTIVSFCSFVIMTSSPSDLSVAQIDQILPQTQCGKCSYAGCRPYAEAIFRQEADINQCPPGGQAGVDRLAQLLNQPSKLLNPDFGLEKPRQLAVIVEADCIGCTRCLPPCPVDAIVGASKQMHTVIAEQCTGCELCLADCPVSCILMVDAGQIRFDPDQARRRYQARNQRLAQKNQEKQARLLRQKQLLAKLKQASDSVQNS